MKAEAVVSSHFVHIISHYILKKCQAYLELHSSVTDFASVQNTDSVMFWWTIALLEHVLHFEGFYKKRKTLNSTRPRSHFQHSIS